MPRMSIILLISSLLFTINGLTVDLIEQDFNTPIEKLLLFKDHLFVGTVSSLHRLSALDLTRTRASLNLSAQYHFKILFAVDEKNLLLCGTTHQGSCQMIDEDFRFILNSSLPIVANDPVNSTIGLIIPEKNLIYFGVTYTNEGLYRWRIPNISGRSLNATNFMRILSVNDDDTISRDDLSLRFMPRQQATFIVQYIYSFTRGSYIYFISNQPQDLDQTIVITKIVRFCRNTSTSIIRSYTELPLVCSTSDWLVQSAQTIIDDNDQMILIGLFRKRDGSSGTNICSWKIASEIDKAFLDNYHNCYSLGIGQRGLNFIKPNEPCRKDESWSIGMTDNDICPWIISDRLPHPVGGSNPIVGRLFYENSMESSTSVQLYPFGSTILFLQGLTNGTWKLGIFDVLSTKITWIYSQQLPSQSAILPEMLFDHRTASILLASGSKVYRLSFANECSSRASCDECLSSLNRPFCGWCPTNERCTLPNDCPRNSWQREANQCTQIINVQPLTALLDQSQWINITLSKLPPLEHDEIYQCIFIHGRISASTQAIKLDANRLSCPAPLNDFTSDGQIGNRFHVRLSVIKWPSNSSIATIANFTFYDCSSHSSCQACRSEGGCQWCSDRCSSICTEKAASQCPSFELLRPSDVFIEAGQTVEIPLRFINTTKSSLNCRLNGSIASLIDENNICRLAKAPEIGGDNDQAIFLSIYENNVSIGMPMKMFIYRCDLYDSCDKCQLRSTCSWCQGRCLSKRENQCSNNSPCTSLKIKNFSPKILPLNGETLVTIYLNEPLNEKIEEITLADVPCVVIRSSTRIECQANASNSSRQGPIRIRLSNSVMIISKGSIEYRRSALISFTPMTVYEFGGQMLQINGNNLLVGNWQQILIGNTPCVPIKPTVSSVLTCRLPSLPSGSYDVAVVIDKKTIVSNGMQLRVTPNPIVQDINPITSFASGGRLVTVRGMYFGSAQSISVEFSHRKWNKKIKINPEEITSSADGTVSSFTFRTPGLPPPSEEFPPPPIDTDFSLHFDHSIVMPNLIQFHYISDVLLNISLIPPTLPYTGEDLKLQVENLTEAASMEDIQLLIACTECKLKTFTSKGITCQPPARLGTNTPLLLNNQPHQVDCSKYNSSLGPIRFRIGFREYLIGYLSYMPSSSPRYSVATIIYLSLASCLLTIALLTMIIFLYIKFKKSQEKTDSLSPIQPIEQTEKTFWSTATSAAAGPYYQVYEQISSLSSHQNTLTRAPLLVCPYHQRYKQDYSTLSLMQQLQGKSPLLTTISVEHERLKKLICASDVKSNSFNRRQSMELFYDLLGMTPFAEAFIDQLVRQNSADLYQSYIYIFRYQPMNFHSFPSTRQLSLLKYISTCFTQSKNNLMELFRLFDNLLHSLVDFLDAGPTDQLLHRSTHSLSSSTLLLLPQLEFHSLQLSINFENLLQFQLSVLDCDTVEQVKEKLARHLASSEPIDLFLPPMNLCSCSHQIPQIKHYPINATIICRKKSSWNPFSEKPNPYLYHLCTDSQIVRDETSIINQLKENKRQFNEKILRSFYTDLLNGIKYLSIDSFEEYIHLISDLIRHLHLLLFSRSTCPVIQSSLNVIADGLEYIFQSNSSASKEIEVLFEDDRKYFSSFNTNLFKLSSPPLRNSLLLSSVDIRSLVLADPTAIECLFKLYQFYELHSEAVNQHIGENHVSVLLPVHHLLVQIRQLINSDTMKTTTTII